MSPVRSARGMNPRAVPVERGVEHHEPGVGLLGHIHGDVGMLQQLVGVLAVVGVQRQADAGLHVQGEPLQHERLLEDGPQLVGDGDGAVAGGDPGQQHGELVTAQPRDGVDLAERALEPLADVDEELVAVVVAEGVVDLFEPVQVDQQQRRREQLPVGRPDGLAGAVAQQGAVGQAGQPVVQRLALGAPLVADQHPTEDDQQAKTRGEDDRRGRHDVAAQRRQARQGLVALVIRAVRYVGLNPVKQPRALGVFDGPHPLLVTSVHGGELPPHRLEVALVVGHQRRDRPAVGLVAVLLQVLDRRLQGLGRLLEARPHPGSRLEAVPVFQQLLSLDREAGSLVGVVEVRQPGRVERCPVGRGGGPQGKPGQRQQHSDDPHHRQPRPGTAAHPFATRAPARS